MDDGGTIVCDKSDPRGASSAVVLALLCVLFLIVMPFVPLILALVEHLTAGTNHVEGFCERIGIHDALSALYKPIFHFLH